MLLGSRERIVTVVIFSLILVFASIALSIQSVEAIKSQGNSLTETTSKQVCGNFLCDEPMSIVEKIAAYLLSLAQQEEPETNILQQAFLPGSFGGERMGSPIPPIGERSFQAPDLKMAAPQIGAKTFKSLDVKQATPRDVKASKLAGNLIQKFDLKEDRLSPAVAKIAEKFQPTLDRDKLTQMRIAQQEQEKLSISKIYVKPKSTESLKQDSIKLDSIISRGDVSEESVISLVTGKVKAKTSSFSPGMEAEVIVLCDLGKKALGGGFSSTGDEKFVIWGNHPINSPPTGWKIVGKNTKNSEIQVTAYVVCDNLIGPLDQEVPIYVNTNTEWPTLGAHQVKVKCTNRDDKILSGGFFSAAGPDTIIYQNMQGDMDNKDGIGTGWAYVYTQVDWRYWYVSAQKTNQATNFDLTAYVICMDYTDPMLVGNYVLGSSDTEWQRATPQDSRELVLSCDPGSFAVSSGYVGSDMSVVNFALTNNEETADYVTFYASFPQGVHSEGWKIVYYDNEPGPGYGHTEVVSYLKCLGVPDGWDLPLVNNMQLEVTDTTIITLTTSEPPAIHLGDLTYVILQQPQNGILEETPLPCAPSCGRIVSALYVYTPNSGFVGQDSFTYIIQGWGIYWSEVGTVSITVSSSE